MKEYIFSFSDEIELNGDKRNMLDEMVYGIYNTEKEAILDAMSMYKCYGLRHTHLFVGQAEYFTPRIDSDVVLEDLINRADSNGYDDDEYLANVKNEHIKELDNMLTEVYLAWENKHPEYRNSYYIMTNAVKYSISQLKEEMENLRKREDENE